MCAHLEEKGIVNLSEGARVVSIYSYIIANLYIQTLRHLLHINVFTKLGLANDKVR